MAATCWSRPALATIRTDEPVLGVMTVEIFLTFSEHSPGRVQSLHALVGGMRSDNSEVLSVRPCWLRRLCCRAVQIASGSRTSQRSLHIGSDATAQRCFPSSAGFSPVSAFTQRFVGMPAGKVHLGFNPEMQKNTFLCRAVACPPTLREMSRYGCPTSPDWDSDIEVGSEDEEASMGNLRHVLEGSLGESIRACLVLGMRATVSRWNVAACMGSFFWKRSPRTNLCPLSTNQS